MAIDEETAKEMIGKTVAAVIISADNTVRVTVDETGVSSDGNLENKTVVIFTDGTRITL